MDLRSSERKDVPTLHQDEKRRIWLAWHKAGSWDNFLHSVKAQINKGGQETVLKYQNQRLDEYETKFVDPISGIDNYFEEKTVVFTQDHKSAPRINTGYFLPRNYWDWCYNEIINDPKFVHPFQGKNKDPDESYKQALRISARLELMKYGMKMAEQTDESINETLVKLAMQKKEILAKKEKEVLLGKD